VEQRTVENEYQVGRMSLALQQKVKDLEQLVKELKERVEILEQRKKPGPKPK
jgi:hypothetical protein